MDKIKAVSTLIIMDKNPAHCITENFKSTKEVELLLSVKFKDLINGNYRYKIPKDVLNNARCIYPNCKTHLGFLLYNLKKNNHSLCQSLLNLPDNMRLLCQVEVPKPHLKRYKNIDVGFTSNGKTEVVDKNPIETAIRETHEETRIVLNETYFSEAIQKKKRKKYNIDIPFQVYFEESKLLLYIIII